MCGCWNKGGVVTEMHVSEVQLSDHEQQPASKLVKKEPAPQPTVAFNAVTECPTPGGRHPFLLYHALPVAMQTIATEVHDSATQTNPWSPCICESVLSGEPLTEKEVEEINSAISSISPCIE